LASHSVRCTLHFTLTSRNFLLTPPHHLNFNLIAFFCSSTSLRELPKKTTQKFWLATMQTLEI
jgi:hypothetical protein